MYISSTFMLKVIENKKNIEVALTKINILEVKIYLSRKKGNGFI